MTTYRCKYPPLRKGELAELLNISASTLARWLNSKYYEELEKLGYQKKNITLEPELVKYLCEKLSIELIDVENLKQKESHKKFSSRYES